MGGGINHLFPLFNHALREGALKWKYGAFMRDGGASRGFFMLKKFITKDDGATAIEYGLIAAGIALAIVVAVFALGSRLNLFFNAVLDSF